MSITLNCQYGYIAFFLKSQHILSYVQSFFILYAYICQHSLTHNLCLFIYVIYQVICQILLNYQQFQYNYQHITSLSDKRKHFKSSININEYFLHLLLTYIKKSKHLFTFNQVNLALYTSTGVIFQQSICAFTQLLDQCICVRKKTKKFRMTHMIKGLAKHQCHQWPSTESDRDQNKLVNEAFELTLKHGAQLDIISIHCSTLI